MNAQQIITQLCSDVGIVINGEQAWDLQVHDERFYSRTLAEGALGLGETYMLGWWDSDDLFGLISRLLSSENIDKFKYAGWRTSLAFLKAGLANIQTVRQTRHLADAHYNLSNELFEQHAGPVDGLFLCLLAECG